MRLPALLALLLLTSATVIPAAPGLSPLRPPGVVIDHRPGSTRQYLGSPSLAVLPNGTYVAAHDVFAVSRTAYDDGFGGAHNPLDANYVTFHRFPDFRINGSTARARD